MKSQNIYDFLIAGSGFAGSITAMILAKSGFRVCLIEKESHPRFAIGESSTPIADMILRDLAEQYNLPFLKKMSRYGEWQKHYPEITCGLKRGFSYYGHQKGETYVGDRKHSRELLVAASENDYNSDTNWLRSDTDHFFVKQAEQFGVDYVDKTTLHSLERIAAEKRWVVQAQSGQGSRKISARWIIDATGSPQVSQKWFGTKSSAAGFETHSSALFSHFEGAEHWHHILEKENTFMDDYPYNSDFSALHHLLEEGWMWMLRFNNNLLSAGILFDETKPDQANRHGNPEKVWELVISQYPSLKKLFLNARQAEDPGTWIATKRLQRKLDKTFGDGWLALPHTSGFVDPLHSTGIAHTLTGIEKIADLFSEHENNEEILEGLKKTERHFFKELEFIDLLVSACYMTRNNFSLFSACTMLYFAASVTYEQARLKGDIPESFLCAGNPELFDAVQSIHQKIKKYLGDIPPDESEKLIREIRDRIKPYNKVGLMDPGANNMYRHTAVVL
ncbi:MAG: FAD-dependent oxidoreductase [Balneolaceae bacterium]